MQTQLYHKYVFISTFVFVNSIFLHFIKFVFNHDGSNLKFSSSVSLLAKQKLRRFKSMHLVQTYMYFELRFLFSLLFSKHVKLILVLHKACVTERFKYFAAGAILNGKTQTNDFGKNSSTNRCEIET